MSARLEILAIEGLGEIGTGDALGSAIASASRLREGDVVVVSQKVVSKAEGRVVELAEIEPSPQAHQLASSVNKDPRIVELVLRESRQVVRAEPGVLIAETRGGWICANAGIDSSNLPTEGTVALLPEDADASARRLRDELEAASGRRPAVLISDSFGRPWRLGQAEVAIGCAGLRALDDWRGRLDRNERQLAATLIAVADQAAAAADLVRDKRSGVPASIVRGLSRHVTPEDGPGAVVLQRPEEEDLFR